MDFLGPIGLTIAIAWILEKSGGVAIAWWRRRSASLEHAMHGTPAAAAVSPATSDSGAPEGWRLKFDFRFVVIGAILPDLIDKPLGFWVAPELVNNSLRSFGHSLSFALIATALVWVATRRRGPSATAGFALALAAHLLFDQMWQMPRSLLWPFLGRSFPEGTVPLTFWVHRHFMHPAVRLHDLIGIAILAVAAGVVSVRLVVNGVRRVRQRPQVASR